MPNYIRLCVCVCECALHIPSSSPFRVGKLNAARPLCNNKKHVAAKCDDRLWINKSAHICSASAYVLFAFFLSCRLGQLDVFNNTKNANGKKQPANNTRVYAPSRIHKRMRVPTCIPYVQIEIEWMNEWMYLYVCGTSMEIERSVYLLFINADYCQRQQPATISHLFVILVRRHKSHTLFTTRPIM